LKNFLKKEDFTSSYIRNLPKKKKINEWLVIFVYIKKMKKILFSYLQVPRPETQKKRLKKREKKEQFSKVR
jgi:hypothetical protein